jgi:signal transduction histidine kinase
MKPEGEVTGRLLPTLIGGFVLLILLLVASVYIGVGAMRSAEAGAARLVEEQRAAMQLIDDVHGEEDSLSSIFYSLAAGRRERLRADMRQRLDAIQAGIHRAVDQASRSPEASIWQRVRAAADAFIAEVGAALDTGGLPSDAFFRTHEQFVDAVAELAKRDLDSSGAKAHAESERAQARVRVSLVLLGVALAVATAAAVFTIYVVNQIFRRLRWQASELAHLSSRSMSDQEAMAQRFSHELHDHFGQSLSAIEANLVAMQNSGAYQASRIEDCLALIKEAVDNVREASQLLRPSILDDFGLDASLRWLAESFSERTGIRVEYRGSFSERLESETETQLFRIAQEALTNVARHSSATEARMELSSDGNTLRLTVADNGKGFVSEKARTGMGLPGMRARARTAHGLLKIESVHGQGVTIRVELPLRRLRYAPKDSHLISR